MTDLACMGPLTTNRLQELMAEKGFAVIAVFDAKPAFAYTVGLHGMGLPEVLMLGLHPRSLAVFINGVADWIRTTPPVDGMENTSLAKNNMRLALKEVPLDAARKYVIQALYYAGAEAPVRVMQAVWSDTGNRMPWEPGWETRFDRDQPRLWESTQVKS